MRENPEAISIIDHIEGLEEAFNQRIPNNPRLFIIAKILAEASDNGETLNMHEVYNYWGPGVWNFKQDISETYVEDGCLTTDPALVLYDDILKVGEFINALEDFPIKFIRQSVDIEGSFSLFKYAYAFRLENTESKVSRLKSTNKDKIYSKQNEIIYHCADVWFQVLLFLAYQKDEGNTTSKLTGDELVRIFSQSSLEWCVDTKGYKNGWGGLDRNKMIEIMKEHLEKLNEILNEIGLEVYPLKGKVGGFGLRSTSEGISSDVLAEVVNIADLRKKDE